MAVYTQVDEGALRGFLDGYDLGALVAFRGIEAGIENTNYFVTTTAGEFVLTLFESVAEAELPWFLELMAWLAERDVPSAHPLADRSGRMLTALCGRPAALVQRLPGTSEMTPEPHHCHEVGRLLARLHAAGRSFGPRRANPRGAVWRQTVAGRVRAHLPADEAGLLEAELRFQAAAPEGLPDGVVHADLFRDNVLFNDRRVSGVIDFYYACHDAWLLDVAVTANDWCCDEGGAFRLDHLEALLQGYRTVRPFDRAEMAAWPWVARAAALRFWLSRLEDFYFPRADDAGYIKDPGQYQRILLARIDDGGEVARRLA